jgi:hypothetical protein
MLNNSLVLLINYIFILFHSCIQPMKVECSDSLGVQAEHVFSLYALSINCEQFIFLPRVD